MTGFLTLLAAHALTATALALAVALACRFLRHAAVIHALWVLVLLKLLTPPLVELAVVPRWHEALLAATTQAETRETMTTRSETLPAVGPWDTSPAATTALAAEPGATPAASPSLYASHPLSTKKDPSGWYLSPGALLLALLAAGSTAILAISIARLRRFQRQLATATLAPPWLQARTAALAAQLGLRRTPPVRLVPATLSPMLWGPPTAVSVLLPIALLARLDRDELDTIITHELAHLRRGDPWVRLLELTATVLFWWHPVLWWARLRLRQVEETSCDAWVAHALPGRARAYAEGLLKTLELLHGSPSPLPALATGISTRNDLEKRLTMIMTERTPRLLTPRYRWFIALVALAALLVVPTWAERRGDDDPEGERVEESWAEDHDWESEVSSAEIAAARAEASAAARWSDEDEAAQEARFAARMEALKSEEASYRVRMRDLERQAMVLAEQLQAVEAQRETLAYELDEKRSRLEAEVLATRAAELEANHHQQEAAELRREAENARRQHELRLRERALSEAEHQELRPLEHKLHSMELELEELYAKEANEAARALEEAMEAHRNELERRTYEHELRASKLELAHHDQILDQLEGELESLRSEGLEAEAREVALEIERLRAHRREIEDMKAALERRGR